MKKINFSKIGVGKKIVMLTAYDCQTATLLESAGVDIVLVGDSLGMVVLGYNNTRNVSMDDMLHHTRAVANGIKSTPIVADMPRGTYSLTKKAVSNARLLLKAGADAIKTEGLNPKVTSALIKAKIPVMGHLGLLPQTTKQYRVQGREEKDAEKILKQAMKLESLGVFAIVLECIPENLAEKITNTINIPTIGIGAGKHCSGQVLVTNDLLCLNPEFKPRFVKRYANLSASIKKAVTNFKQDVRLGRFPSKETSFQ
ncbi:MAG: 3-methyl-2-oxobutanoate hydroxymethyltransferase [Candidatus Diapherotrites archaeon]|uniref:3-methyl-2-oxobutanoate hydroxymethyltransferase n=1 Tax=Candidatus Iainarchaeum sp. TaxID=3101447 RepID=A0A2D6M0B2_9ARCH|nr:3-methyl-2-oxobutanoate hydroxymethyltransferase [Candidatus Diapherotrites archaeon]|tara:strand:- start:631 stop:1398 length:768 start_codon:yes stop_codon:yes gene_type:complete